MARNYTLKPIYTPVARRDDAATGGEAAEPAEAGQQQADARARRLGETPAGQPAGIRAGRPATTRASQPAGTGTSKPAGVGASQPAEIGAAQLHADDCIRAENEDDDGYDPYSDRVEPAPLFERDPWR